MLYHYVDYACPIGKIRIVADDIGLVALSLRGQTNAYAETRMDNRETSILQKAVFWLDRYFACRVPQTVVPLHWRGTPFQEIVWERLTKIPYGQSTTYGNIAIRVARRMGKARMSSQAVGQAIGKNPIAIIVPCHRVLGKNQRLTGYAGGIDYKKALLSLEKIPYRT